jgi:hypothetical protein
VLCVSAVKGFRLSTLRLSDSPILRLSDSQTLRLSDCANLKFYAVTEKVFRSREDFTLCTQTSFLREPSASSSPWLSLYPTSWAIPPERAFNGQLSAYLFVDLPRSQLAQYNLRLDGRTSRCNILLEKAYRYCGQFITCPGCQTPTGDLDRESVVWHLSQRLMLI